MWSAIGDADEVRVSKERAAILAVLRKATEPMSPGNIADAVNDNTNNVKQRLFKMVAAGQL